MSVTVDYNLDAALTKQANDLLPEYYMLSDEKSPQDAFARAAVAFCAGDMELAQRIYDYVSRGWFMYASPVLSNAPRPGEKGNGMPISCFLNFVDDKRKGLVDHRQETAWLTFMGGGVGGTWSDIRAVSKKSNGPIPHIRVIDSQMLSDSQGKTRRGSYAAYLDISSPDIIEFIELRNPTGGDPNRKCPNINIAVNIPDSFMEAVLNDGEWDLICPHEKTVRETVKARMLWKKILETRFATGEPYLHFIDASNRALPETMKQKGLKIKGSNLCSEIVLPTSPDRTAVCCLSSLNLEKWEEWKDTRIVADLICFLDNVLQYFIDNAPPELSKAVYSASQERSLGLGFMGFHSLLQQKMIPFESEKARALNKQIFEHCSKQATQETLRLGRDRGEAPDMIGTGRRNAHMMAVAPNANSSIILGCSPSIEPLASNAMVHRTRAGSHEIKNPYLDKIIQDRSASLTQVDDIWREIVAARGSIQDNNFFTDQEKKVFKTAHEMDQRWIITHAADRQPFICQAQSVNLFFPFGASAKYVSAVHIMAWKGGLKTLYYLRTEAGKIAEGIGRKVERKALGDALPVHINVGRDSCVACQA